PRRGRIAVGVEHAAPLNAAPGTHRALGIHVAPDVSVFARIRVQNETEGAVALGFACLDAAVRPPVPGDHDFSFDADAERVEGLVVLDQPISDVDGVAGDVAAR